MPPELYTSEKWLALEQAQIFAKEWLCAGRADAAPNAGDYFTFTIAGHPSLSFAKMTAAYAPFPMFACTA